MLKKLTLLLFAATLQWTAWAQDQSPAEEPAADAEVVEVAEQLEADGSAEIDEAAEVVDDADDGVIDEAFDDLDLDEQTYEEDDDDFIPTEEIPADEPIPFPSNI
jgi:hypothetical protein